MIVHGHTKFELTDVNTGEVQIVEEDNLVTNFIEKIFSFDRGGTPQNPSYMKIWDSNYNNNEERFLKYLTQGLMLFDKAIEEDPDIHIAPAGTRMTAYGTDTAYSGTQLQCGSYNISESGWVDDTHMQYKHVWDFATTHGNGEIACACLTTARGGRITEGVENYVSDIALGQGAGPGGISEFYRTVMQVHSGGYPGTPAMPENWNFSGSELRYKASFTFWADYEKDGIITPDWDELTSTPTNDDFFTRTFIHKKKLSFYKEPLRIKSDKLFNLSHFPKTLIAQIDVPQSLINEAMTLVGSNKMCFDWCDDKDYLYISISSTSDTYPGSYNQPIRPNEQFLIWKISKKLDGTNTWYKVTNTTGETINHFIKMGKASPWGEWTSFGDWISLHIINNTFLAMGNTTRKIYYIDIENPTNVGVVKTTSGDDYTISGSDINPLLSYNCVNYADDLMAFSLYEGPPFEGALLKFDNTTKQISYFQASHANLSDVHGHSYTANELYNPPFEGLYMSGAWMDPCCVLYEYMSPLITINNLENPVLKTASQTMKVTYTITINRD